MTGTAIPPVRRRMQADRRRAQIVEVAQRLLIDKGYAAVSLRAVSAGCGVSLAAVQYFFPDKALLYAAMIDGMAEQFDRIYQRIGEGVDGGGRHLREFLRYILDEDITSAETAGFFYELWNLAHREPIAAAALQRLYHKQLTRLTRLILDAHPDVDPVDAAQRALVIMSATDGLMMTTGYGKTPPIAYDNSAHAGILEILLGIARHG